jgi:L-asparaginase II
MKTLPPIEIVVTRGGRPESRHLVDAVIADASGGIVAMHGEGERVVFPRSAVKALQALALVESGAADRFGFEPRHIALACSSHAGEDMHVEGARQMLEKAGLEPVCLECGAHWPKRMEDQARLVREGREPVALHNNCSGKHAGFLAFATHEGHVPAGYVRHAHPVQQAIAGIMREMTGAAHGEENRGVDGCSIPTYAIPLSAIAIAFARLAAGEAGPVRAAAMARIREACFAHPQMVSGTGGTDTRIMQALPGRAFVKTGAEGVYTAALPQRGLGIALKARDGATRAAEAALVELLESLLELEGEEAKSLKGIGEPSLFNWNGIEVGRVARG